MYSEYGWKIIDYNPDLFEDDCLVMRPATISPKLEKTLKNFHKAYHTWVMNCS